MMSLTQPETQALGAIADGLAGADPRLASMLTIFSRLAAGEEMPARQTTRVRRGRPAAPRPRPRCMHPRLGWQQARLVVAAVISAALVAVALAPTASGPRTCARPMRSACPAPSLPQHAGPGRR